MPDALELPRMLCAVVPLMSGEGVAGLRGGVVHELVALAFRHSLWRGPFARRSPWLRPSFAAIIGPLNDLPEPAAALRRIQPVGVDGRALEVVNLPARKIRAAYIPTLTLSVRRQDERALACANQYSYSAHNLLLVSSTQDRLRKPKQCAHLTC